MATVKGVLQKAKSGYRVVLPTKKGTAEFAIPEAAQQFRMEDASEGLEVDVERDKVNRIVKVTIPGKEEAAPVTSRPSNDDGWRRGGGRREGNRAGVRGGHSQPRAVRSVEKALAPTLGMPFHNPYTFLPFSDQTRERRRPTPLSVDELPDQRDRHTGILRLQVSTRSPLLTCGPDPVEEHAGHKVYEVLRIGPDVIVPATGIRGALRALLTVLTGGAMTHLNPHGYLCQGRDVNLGPATSHSPPSTPEHPSLAEVILPGTAFRNGTVRLGETALVKADDLERLYGNQLKDLRKPDSRQLWVGLDQRGIPVKHGHEKSSDTPWRVKLSGRPVNRKGKREGVFWAAKDTIELPPEMWSAYSSRHAHGDRRELRKGDLVWLEPVRPDQPIRSAEHVASLQWARWGRRGQAIKDERIVPRHAWPDYLREDGLVDEVTDLFGHVSPFGDSKITPFAARVRPENLVFENAAERVERTTLAPLQPPHAGCIAFYRNNADPDDVSEEDGLRGYKIYRTTKERGEEAPWHYSAQGVYDTRGQLENPRQKVNRTCDLLGEGVEGRLQIAFRGLTTRELALLLQACHLMWRLGGGKPLGLGLCAVRVTGLLDEEGEPLRLPGWTVEAGPDEALRIAGWQEQVADLQARADMWTASQRPVERLRYPRAVDRNNFRITRGGHVWFQRHAMPRKVESKGDEGREKGLQPMHVGGELEAGIRGSDPQSLDATQPLVAAQPLPLFDPVDPLADLLYGYDAFPSQVEDSQRPRRRTYLQLEPFDPERHVTGTEQSEGSHGKDAAFRKRQKRGRTEGEG